MKNSHAKAVLFAMLANVIFGFSFMFSRIALGITTPFIMLSWRFVTTFAMMSVIAAFFARRKGSAPQGVDWKRFDLKGRSILPLLALGLVQPVGYFFCESYGISLTNATFSGVIIALIPIVAIIGGVLFLHERPKKLQVSFAILSITGVILMTIQQQEAGQIRPLGVLLLFGAVITGAYYNVLSRKTSEAFSAFERTFVMMGVAAVVFTVIALIQTRNDLSRYIEPLAHPEFILSILYLSVLSSVVAFMALNYANGVLPVARTTSFANLTTVVSLLAGVVFLHEPFTPVSLLASIMIVTGVYGIQRI